MALAEYEKTRAVQPASDAIRRDLAEAEHRRDKCAQSVRRLIDEQAKARSKTVKAVLHQKMAQLDEQAEDLDRQVEDLKERLAAAEDDGTVDRLRLAVVITAERLARGVFTFEERRDFIKALGFGFSASREVTG
jgi:chromosome segregation ATPase